MNNAVMPTEDGDGAAFHLAGKRVWVAGHKGMVGSALVRRLAGEGCEIVTADRKDADLTRQADVEAWMAAQKPDAIFLAAAKVGGILANETYPADFLFDNLAIQTNVIEAARSNSVGKLMILGSSCIYPRLAPQPIQESSLLTGSLEPTNEWYAIAKIAGIKLGQAYRLQYGCDFISAMPTNLYGPGDNFDPANAMVVPSLMARLRSGERPLRIWGDGSAVRDIAYSKDVATGVILALHHGTGDGFVNLGSGTGVSIRQLVEALRQVVDFEFEFDTSKSSGFPRRVMDISKARRMIGYDPSTPLTTGLRETWEWYLANHDEHQKKVNFFR